MKFRVLATIGLFSISSFVTGQEASLDDYWANTQLYQSDAFSFTLSGRLHGNAVAIDESESDYEEMQWRRFRLGGKGHFDGYSFKLEADFDLNDGAKYKRITDAYVSWVTNEGTKIKVLKQSAGFTLDGATSSNKLKTLERSNIANNLWFTKEYFTGIKVSGRVNQQMTYQAGVYSSDGDDEFGVGAGVFGLMSMTYQVKESEFWETISYRVDYVFNEEDEAANTRDFSQVLSTSVKVKKGAWGVDSEFAAGRGYFEQSDLWGISTMPYLNLNEKIQLVARYTYMKSTEINGLRLNRYEAKAVDGQGDKYYELYTGVNYFINSNKLKLQLGAQYTDMQDKANDGGEFSGVSIVAGIRAYW